MNEPKCSLCAGRLQRERNVQLGNDHIQLSLAWVCTDCSAAFPIAVRPTTLLRSHTPMYADGKRYE